MTGDLQVGTLVAGTNGTGSRLTGTVSGIDTNALVENAVSANNIPADLLDIQIAENEALIAAYEEFFGLSFNLQNSLEALKSQTSSASTVNNVFEQRTADLQASGGNATGLINVSLDEGAAVDQYSIIVQQKAEAFSVGSTTVTDGTSALGFSGEFSIAEDGATATSITIDVDDTLFDIRDAINAVSTDTGVTADILQVSETEFQLIISGTNTNTAVTASTISGDVLQNLGIVNVTDTFEAAQIIQNEQGSQITLNGATITRDDNTYDDLLDGISFEILAADATSTITLDVENDIGSAKAAIEDFVANYNAFREFVTRNQQVNADGTIPEDALLFSESLLENLNFQISALISGEGGSSSLFSNLATLGISINDANLLEIDNASLDEALLSNFDEVQNLFTSSITTDNSQLGLISNTSTAEELNFTLDITVDGDGNITNVTGGNFTIDGTRLIGVAGTQFEGITLAYVGTTSATIDVNITAGLADLLFNNLEGYTASGTGQIDQQIALLNAENDDFSEEASEIRARGEVIREQEIQKYAALEAELVRLESLQRTLRALLGISDDD